MQTKEITIRFEDFQRQYPFFLDAYVKIKKKVVYKIK